MGERGRRGFTLIELIVVTAIMGAMVTVGVVSLNSSRGATRVFAAARDVMSMIRRARSVAIITQKPAVLTYSNTTVDDEPCASVELVSMKLFVSRGPSVPVQTLEGESVAEDEAPPANDDDATAGEDGGEDDGSGSTLEEALSPQNIPENVVRGIKIKVLEVDEELLLTPNESKSSKISIFSTADNVSRSISPSSAPSSASGGESGDPPDAEDEDFSPVKVVFSENGMVNPPHKIWIYEEGSTPEKGVFIEVDRFGEPVCKEVE